MDDIKNQRHKESQNTRILSKVESENILKKRMEKEQLHSVKVAHNLIRKSDKSQELTNKWISKFLQLSH